VLSGGILVPVTITVSTLYCGKLSVTLVNLYCHEPGANSSDRKVRGR
jgi:hypothetical protein